MPGTLRAALHPDFPHALCEGHAPDGAEAITRAVAQRIASLRVGGGVAPEVRADEAALTLLELLHGQALATVLSGSAGEALAQDSGDLPPPPSPGQRWS